MINICWTKISWSMKIIGKIINSNFHSLTSLLFFAIKHQSGQTPVIHFIKTSDLFQTTSDISPMINHMCPSSPNGCSVDLFWLVQPWFTNSHEALCHYISKPIVTFAVHLSNWAWEDNVPPHICWKLTSLFWKTDSLCFVFSSLRGLTFEVKSGNFIKLDEHGYILR